MDKKTKKIVSKIESYKWEKWLERLYGSFMVSLFSECGTKKYFRKIGIPNLEIEAQAFERNIWYRCDEILDKAASALEKYLKNHDIFYITKIFREFYKKKRKRIIGLVKNRKTEKIDKLKEFYEIITVVTTYIWLAHILERIYDKKLRILIPRHYKGNVDALIAGAGFSSRKAAHEMMGEKILQKISPQKIAERYGWIKIRDGFSEPFSAEEISKMKIKKPAIRQNINVPKKLKKVFKEFRELVWFRTARTDVFYEFIYLARPLLKDIGKLYGISFCELSNYPIQNLINKSPIKIKRPFTWITYKGKFCFLKKKLFSEKKLLAKTTIKGMVAMPGKVSGIARIIKDPSEINRVKNGDVLVTQMTFPAFLPAMRRANAFVTDEGGITTHAAIVARELNKPCIIGTKIATKVLKDGQLVEVDANKGIIRIIKKN